MPGTPSLFKSSDPNSIGNTAQNVLPSQNVSVAPDGYGQPVTVVKFQPSATGGWRAADALLDQENDPLVLTASVSAVGVQRSLFAGPITGIALFASGSGNAQVVEFDIPLATADEPGSSIVNTLRGGTQISVPATSLEIRARNDASLIPDTVFAIPNIAIGNGGIAAYVTGSIAKGTKPTYARATKTVWLINRSGAVAQFGPTDFGVIKIPPFASSVRVMRWGSGVGTPSAQIQIEIVAGPVNPVDSVTVPVGTLCPDILLGGQARNLIITNTDAAITLQKIAAVFTLAI